VHWLVLILSGTLEAVWATALAASDGFRRPRPTVLFAAALVLSMVGLAWAMTALPAGTAYAVWVGIGAVGTVLLAVARGEERLGAPRAALLLLLVGCVAGLKAVA
jgi:quaternary ammonium compound-resistance protein SugE